MNHAESLAIAARYERATVKTTQYTTRRGTWGYLVDTGNAADRWSAISYATQGEAEKAGETCRRFFVDHFTLDMGNLLQ